MALALAACQPDTSADNLSAINQLRANVAVAELTRAGELDAKAKEQADTMAQHGSISTRQISPPV